MLLRMDKYRFFAVEIVCVVWFAYSSAAGASSNMDLSS